MSVGASKIWDWTLEGVRKSETGGILGYTLYVDMSRYQVKPGNEGVEAPPPDYCKEIVGCVDNAPY